MKSYQKNETLISIHIPKTGGTSLEMVLRKWFGPRLYLHYYDEKNNQPPTVAPWRPGVCIHGHFNRARQFGIADYYPEARQFIAFLRNPFEIVVSRYFDVRRREAVGTAYRDGKPLILPNDIGTYLEEEIGKKDYHPNIMDYMPEGMTERNYREYLKEFFIYIGIMEDYPGSLAQLSKRLGFLEAIPPHENQTPRPLDMSEICRFRQQFMDIHPWPFEFYEFVRTHYNSGFNRQV